MNKRNYQKELDVLLTGLEREKECRLFCFIAAVRHAAAIVSNT